MQADVMQGQWQHIHGKVRERWSKITNDDLDRIEGHPDQLASLIQERYGYARDRAEQEVDTFLREMNDRLGDTARMTKRK